MTLPTTTRPWEKAGVWRQNLATRRVTAMALVIADPDCVGKTLKVSGRTASYIKRGVRASLGFPNKRWRSDAHRSPESAGRRELTGYEGRLVSTVAERYRVLRAGYGPSTRWPQPGSATGTLAPGEWSPLTGLKAALESSMLDRWGRMVCAATPVPMWASAAVEEPLPEPAALEEIDTAIRLAIEESTMDAYIGTIPALRTRLEEIGIHVKHTTTLTNRIRSYALRQTAGLRASLVTPPSKSTNTPAVWRIELGVVQDVVAEAAEARREVPHPNSGHAERHDDEGGATRRPRRTERDLLADMGLFDYNLHAATVEQDTEAQVTGIPLPPAPEPAPPATNDIEAAIKEIVVWMDTYRVEELRLDRQGRVGLSNSPKKRLPTTITYTITKSRERSS